MSSVGFGSWFTYSKPEWEDKLDDAADYVIDKTGMSRNQLKRVLQYLTEQEII